MIARFVDWLSRRARPQFHGAIVLIVGWPVFLLAVYALRWVMAGIYWLFGERVESRFAVVALLSGLIVVGEWVRACVKLWLGRSAGEGSLVATAVTGACVGAMFDACLIFMWGNDGWREVVICAVLASVVYLGIDLCVRWDGRRKQTLR